MPEKGLRPGFTFPLGVGSFGISCPKFMVSLSGNGFAIPGDRNRPLFRSMFSATEEGLCRFEMLPPNANPMQDDSSRALFVADKVKFRWASHHSQPEPFAVLGCQQLDDFIDSLKQFVGQTVHLRFTPMAEVKIKQPDPWNKGWTLGWGVYRDDPWEFRGLFDNEEEARAAARERGSDYKVAYGSNEDGTDNFITTGFE